MAGGDVRGVAHCEVPSLVNIAHISKVNDLRVLLRPTIARAPSQACRRAGRGTDVPAKLASTGGPRCGASALKQRDRKRQGHQQCGG
jgi:hypothetical protein